MVNTRSKDGKTTASSTGDSGHATTSTARIPTLATPATATTSATVHATMPAPAPIAPASATEQSAPPTAAPATASHEASATATTSEDTSFSPTASATTRTVMTNQPSEAAATTFVAPIRRVFNPRANDTSSRQSATSRRSQRARLLARAREELAQKEVELAKARVLALEAQEDDTEDEEDDTIIAGIDASQRVGIWLHESQQHPPTVDKSHHLEERSTEPAIATEMRASTMTAPANAAVTSATLHTHAPPPPLEPPTTQAFEFTAGPAIEQRMKENDHVSTRHAQPEATVTAPRKTNDFSDLAAAITLAVRAGQQQSTRFFSELPTFNGAYQEWLAFRAAYNESSTNFSDIENTARLRKSLKGKAREAVECLLFNNSKPQEILRTLETRFGRPDAIALAELERLRALPRLTDSPRELCVFSTRVNNIIATLKALQRVHFMYSPEVVKCISDKLTTTLRYRWFDFAAMQDPEQPDLQKMADFLSKEADLCSPFAQPEVITYEATAGAQRRPQRAFSTTEKKSTCPVCASETHNIKGCEKFKQVDTDARWDLAKKHRLCFRCLKYRNKSHRCKTEYCNENGCKYTHNKLLHSSTWKREQLDNNKEPEDVRKEAVTSTWTPQKTQSFLKIVPVSVSGPAGEVDTHALLDDGSTVTLVDADLADQIGAQGPLDPLYIEAISDTRVASPSSRRVTLTLRGTSSTYEVKARTMKSLQLSSQEVNEAELKDCKHLEEIIEELTYSDAKPLLLIGQDNWDLLVASQIKTGKRSQPVASLTPLGWTLHGTHTRSLGRKMEFVHHVQTSDDIERQMKQYFALESLLITPKRPQNDPEARALRMLEKETRQERDGRYETALLWKSDNESLPNNYDNSLRRLISIERKIDRDPQLKVKYMEQMEALVHKGYAERAPSEKSSTRTWYLPHFAVTHPMKPGKIRIVHDAAAKTQGVSLNDKLLTGPDLLQSLPGVLMRFRQHPVAVTADIAEMFMQVKIKPADRDALRYLWRGDRRDDKPPEEYRMTSLIFGATSSPSTAIFVKDLNASKHVEKHPDAVEAIKNKHYVDDYLDSFADEASAIKVASEVRDIHRLAHYELRKWVSNSREVLKKLGGPQATEQTVSITDGSDTERVLGLIWEPSCDKLAFNLDMARLPAALHNTTPTKRDALRIVMSLFDPLGLASPITSKAKQLLQEVWRRGTDWDQPLDEDLAAQWSDWTKHLKDLRNVKIPRCYLSYTTAKRLQLHTFTDSSESSYAAAIYWRAEAPDGNVELTLVLAKSRVAPLKLTSIPRLELQAAVMGSRMAAAVVEEHESKPETKTFWTDSKTVLTWLKTGSRSYRPFVAHRIAAIEENDAVNEWRWIPTKLNVADDATRDVPQDLNEQHRWFKGPEFLLQPSTEWPQEKPTLTAKTGEEKVNIVQERKGQKINDCIPDPIRFSKWERLLRSTARVLQFVRLMRRTTEKINYKRTKKNKETDPKWGQSYKKRTTTARANKKPAITKYYPIDANLLREAEVLLVRACQSDSFSEELKDLANNRAISPSSRLRPLSVILLNGVIKLRSRIGSAEDVTEEMKSPAILDGNHRVTKLWIEHMHRRLMHAGVETTINECRQHYWILRLRPVMRTIANECLPCKIRRSLPPRPPTGDHPRCRLAHHQRPFSFTGLDYFGPLTVTVARSTQKRYVAIFTCLTTRAVHLEMASSLSTDSAVMALRRMIARRGQPTEIWSDNGTNLHGAEKDLRRAIDMATQEEAEKKIIRWRFIPPGAPFMGGAWERLVRSVKTALAVVLRERHPSEEVLRTLLTEAEYTVNSRPLTHVSVQPEDPEAITPNHFLLGGSALVSSPGTFDDQDLIGRTHWRASQRLADLFWARWLREYLPELQHRREPHGRGVGLSKGDVVLVADGTLPRNTWPRGIITAVYPGADGIVRAVDVCTRGGVLRRPAKKLVPLLTSLVVPETPDATTPETTMHGGRDVQNDA